MNTTVAISLAPEELSELDCLRREQSTSRAEVLREALRWYARWGELLPVEDPIGEESDP
jgi:metal-responsive CopG/Arc/MetJ family transcriptional regulator